MKLKIVILNESSQKHISWFYLTKALKMQNSIEWQKADYLLTWTGNIGIYGYKEAWEILFQNINTLNLVCCGGFMKKKRYIRLPDVNNWLIGKDPNAGKDWRQEKGMTEDEMVWWHHQLNGYEFEQAPGVGDGQGSLACCRPWDHKELDMTEWLNWTEIHNLCNHRWLGRTSHITQ